MIDSFVFSLLIAPVAKGWPNPELDQLSSILPSFVRGAVSICQRASRLKLEHAGDHAVASLFPLLADYPTRFGDTPNAHVEGALKGQLKIQFVFVPQQLIEAGDIDPIAEMLNDMVATRESATAFRLRVGIMVEGFDSDPRGLWKISPVRCFFRRLFTRCPFVFLIAHPEGGLLRLLMACWLYDEEDNSEQAQEQRTSDFLTLAFQGLNQTAYRLAISEATNREIVDIGMKALFGE
jgi:hypothetical protein